MTSDMQRAPFASARVRPPVRVRDRVSRVKCRIEHRRLPVTPTCNAPARADTLWWCNGWRSELSSSRTRASPESGPSTDDYRGTRIGIGCVPGAVRGVYFFYRRVHLSPGWYRHAPSAHHKRSDWGTMLRNTCNGKYPVKRRKFKKVV